MINKTTGALVFDSGMRIEPTLSLDGLIASLPVGAGEVQGQPDQPWRGCYLANCVANGLSFGIQLTYEGQRLYSAQIGPESSAGPTGWEDPHLLDKILAVKAENDAFATAWLGPPPWDYPWGTVSSSFDERGYSAVFLVRYARRAQE